MSKVENKLTAEIVLLNKEISHLKEIIEAQHGNQLSMGETNRAMGERLLKYEGALKSINSQNNMQDISELVNAALKLPLSNTPKP